MDEGEWRGAEQGQGKRGPSEARDGGRKEQKAVIERGEGEGAGVRVEVKKRRNRCMRMRKGGRRRRIEMQVKLE